jgi:hypothetical protein
LLPVAHLFKFGLFQLIEAQTLLVVSCIESRFRKFIKLELLVIQRVIDDHVSSLNCGRCKLNYGLIAFVNRVFLSEGVAAECGLEPVPLGSAEFGRVKPKVTAAEKHDVFVGGFGGSVLANLGVYLFQTNLHVPLLL